MLPVSYIHSQADLLFLNTDYANIGNTGGLRGSTVAGSFYWGLHTAYPGRSGDQASNVCAYGSYAYVAAARSSGGFVRTGRVVNPAATVSFPTCTSGSETATHWSLGTKSDGSGDIIRAGPLGTFLGNFVAATSDTLTIPGLSGLAVDDQISFYAFANTSLPTGLTEGTVYYVKTLSGDAITVSTTLGGTTLDITAVGYGLAFRNTQILIYAGVKPQLTTSTAIVEG